jgi:hypothetical protein
VRVKDTQDAKRKRAPPPRAEKKTRALDYVSGPLVPPGFELVQHGRAIVTREEKALITDLIRASNLGIVTSEEHHSEFSANWAAIDVAVDSLASAITLMNHITRVVGAIHAVYAAGPLPLGGSTGRHVHIGYVRFVRTRKQK